MYVCKAETTDGRCHLVVDVWSLRGAPRRRKHPRRFAVGRRVIDRVSDGRVRRLRNGQRCCPSVGRQHVTGNRAFGPDTIVCRDADGTAFHRFTGPPHRVSTGFRAAESTMNPSRMHPNGNWMTVRQRWWDRWSFNFSRTGRQSLRRPTRYFTFNT